MINKTVRAVAAVQGVGLALRGAHEPPHCSGDCSRSLQWWGPRAPRGGHDPPSAFSLSRPPHILYIYLRHFAYF